MVLVFIVCGIPGEYAVLNNNYYVQLTEFQHHRSSYWRSFSCKMKADPGFINYRGNKVESGGCSNSVSSERRSICSVLPSVLYQQRGVSLWPNSRCLVTARLWSRTLSLCSDFWEIPCSTQQESLLGGRRRISRCLRSAGGGIGRFWLLFGCVV